MERCRRDLVSPLWKGALSPPSSYSDLPRGKGSWVGVGKGHGSHCCLPAEHPGSTRHLQPAPGAQEGGKEEWKS